MDDKLPVANGKRMHIADGQVIYGCRARDNLQAHDRRHRAIELLHLVARAQLSCSDPAARGQPGMLLGRVNRLQLHGRRMTAMTGYRHAFWLRLAAGGMHRQGHIDQVGILVEEHLLHGLRGNGFARRIIRLDLLSNRKGANGLLAGGRGDQGIGPEGETTGSGASSASVSTPSAAPPASLAAPLNRAPAPSITPAVTPPTSATWATPSISGLPLMALLAICPAPLARAPTAILATGPASGPASPDTAPETAPTTAACAISPNEVGLPCTALETTVVATLIAAPITAPRIIVHSGQQCPLGSLRVSGLSPT